VKSFSFPFVEEMILYFVRIGKAPV
jgi:hypothetical protein